MYERLPLDYLLFERYRIKSILSAGLISTLYVAQDMKPSQRMRLLAVKEYLNTSDDPAQHQARFRRFQLEATVLATLSHPAIPQLYEFTSIQDRAYLITEFIEGQNLEQLQAKTTSLSVNAITGWAIEIADALHYLSTYTPPLVHRNVQPTNIMLDNLGRARLINFSIPRIFQQQVRSVTIGVEGYTAPEQFDGHPTPLSDVYSLGATLHHIVTGQDPRQRRPFSFHEYPVRQLNPAVPTALASVIETAVAFRPEDRFGSAVEMKSALEYVRDNPDADVAFARKHIFLSYSRRDTETMQQVRDHLRANGIKVWTDEKLTPGTPEWQQAIAGAIESAAGLVVILSPDAKESPWVERELLYAEGHSVRIFPVLARGDQRTAVPLLLISVQRIDLINDYTGGLHKLVETVRALMSPDMS